MMVVSEHMQHLNTSECRCGAVVLTGRIWCSWSWSVATCSRVVAIGPDTT